MAIARDFGMNGVSVALALAFVFVLMVLASPASQAQTFQILHNFTGGADGANPHSGLTIDQAGNLYGTVPFAPASTFTTFDAPGAGTDAYEGTAPFYINTAGDVTGTYSTTGNVAHGFLRTANGTITEFDAPGAGTGNDQGTFAISLNSADTVAGYYADSNNVYHGFVRAASGSITTFDVPGANMTGHAGTVAIGIDAAGDITGAYRDSNLAYHAFVRAPSGGITTFDAPGAGTGYGQGTKAVSINTAGMIAGSFQDENYVYHGYIRAANGTITTFDVPGSGCPGNPPPSASKGAAPSGGSGFGSGTEAISIDDAGDVAGNYTDPNCVRHGFVRTANGVITPFDAPGAGTGAGMIQGTGGFSINASAVVAGTYADANAVVHGFLRATNGTIASLDAPGAGTGMFQGTVGFGINTAGEITGTYLDASSVGHGYVLTPSTVGYGAVYKLTHRGSGWTINPVYTFSNASNGANPEAGVIVGPNGSLYGTTIYGGTSGSGTVFNLRPSATACVAVLCPWQETVLYSFLNGGDGAYPGYGNLIFQAGDIYGSTAGGGNSGLGTVYELMPSGDGWTESVLHSFSGSDGATPFSGVLFDSSGNLYGTTTAGGTGNAGTVFKMTYSSGSGWTESVLYSFLNGNDGGYPTAGLTLGSSGVLYGATSNGGSGGGGTVFKLTPSGGSWTYSLIYSFAGGADCGPWGALAPDMAGNLYGTTLCDGANNFGSIFKLTQSGSGWTYSSIHAFTGGTGGAFPYGNAVFDSSGNLYGTASAGGADGYGVAWEITP